MFIEEAEWINNTLNKYDKDELSPLLNIGSSSLYFRTVQQSFIHSNIFLPLNSRDVKVLHTDIQKDEGVDLVGDLSDPDFINLLVNNKFRSILCSNLFEHLEIDVRLKVCHAIDKILIPKGYLIITVPYIYPFHADPIDTWYRPSINELSGLFPSYEIIESKYVENNNSYFTELKKRPFNLFLSALKLLIPFYKFSEWKNNIKYLPNWFRNYKVTCLLLQKK